MIAGLASKALKATKWAAFQNWGYRGIGLLIFVVLARLLKPESFGVIALCMVYVSFLQIFLDQGFAEAIIQRKEITGDLLATAFWTNVSLAFILGLLSFTAAPLVAIIFRDSGLAPVVRGLAPLFIIRGVVSVQMAMLWRKMEIRKLAIASVTGVISGGIAGIVAAKAGFGVWALVLYQIVTKLVETAVIWVKSDWRPSVAFNKQSLRHLLNFGFNVTGSRLVNFVNRYGADFVIGFFLGPVALGYYYLAFRLTRTLVELIGSVVQKVSFSLFSRLQDDPETGRKAFHRIIEHLSFLASPVFLGLAVVAPEVTRVVFGEQWITAVPLMRVLALIGLLQSLYYINTGVLLGYGKPRWRLFIDILNAVTNLVVFFVAVNWGLLAVAIGYVLRGYVMAPIPLLTVNKLLGSTIFQYSKRIAGPVFSGVLMGLSIFAIQHGVGFNVTPICLLFVNVAIGSLVYLIAVHFLSPGLTRRTYQFVFSNLH